MRISTILDHIDDGSWALPEFQRGYVWNREQVRDFFDSLYRGYPVGGLLVWATRANDAPYRGEGPLANGIVNLILDGQQRITSLYGVVRGHQPTFFDGNDRSFKELRFHLENEVFEFYQPVSMRDDLLWVDVTRIMHNGPLEISTISTQLINNPQYAGRVGDYIQRLGRLHNVVNIDLHIDEVTGPDKTLDVIVEIFNRVNSRGTRLSRGDLALARICAAWPNARDMMKQKLEDWETRGYNFSLDWLLRSVNTVLTGEARFSFLHDINVRDIEDGLNRATNCLDICLNIIADRLGLDHDRVLFGRNALPIMVRYLDRLYRRGDSPDERDWNKLLFWFVQAGMWGRFSGSTETFIDRDLAVLDNSEDSLGALLEELLLWNGRSYVRSEHFNSSNTGSRFYPVLYMLTRMAEARDWCSGIRLRSHLLGNSSQLELHLIFPKACLRRYGYERQEINAVANFCFLTRMCNRHIGARLPQDYFPEIERDYPNALASQWIPEDRNLWQIENYPDFLEARRRLLAEETNRQLSGLLLGDMELLDAPPPVIGVAAAPEEPGEMEVEDINNWVKEQGLPRGQFSYELPNETAGTQDTILDLAWPNGIQSGLSAPVAVLLDAPSEVMAAASAAGYRCFTTENSFRSYVEVEILGEETGG